MMVYIRNGLFVFYHVWFLLLIVSCRTSDENTLFITGLNETVEVLRDKWGVNHIYAQNQHDLFFAQGYLAAKDRLFQFEIWRRQATGTVAEILGEREIDRDIGSRLFKFRGNMIEEMNHYHDNGREIINAFTDGVNQYIKRVLDNPELLPIEFKILDITPEKWTPEVVISRHQGLLHNIENELKIARSVSKLGVEETKNLFWFHPKDPDLSIDPDINKDLLFDDILKYYKAFKKPIVFHREDISKDRKSTRLNSSHVAISYAVFCLKKKNNR